MASIFKKSSHTGEDNKSIILSQGESLDTAIKKLAFTMARLWFIQIVDYSCSWHLAQTWNHWWRDGYYAFWAGYYPFGIKENSQRAMDFLKEIGDFCQQFKESNLRSLLKEPRKEWDNYSIFLDLVSEDGSRLPYNEKFVPKETVTKVGDDITLFWNTLNEIAEKYLNDNEKLIKVISGTERTVDVIIHGSHLT